MANEYELFDPDWTPGQKIKDWRPGHDVLSVRELSLKGVKSGKLLAQVEARQSEAFITNDKRMEAEGQLRRRPFAILILSVTNWSLMKPRVGKVAEPLEPAQPGSIHKIDCGRFILGKLRKRDPRSDTIVPSWLKHSRARVKLKAYLGIQKSCRKGRTSKPPDGADHVNQIP